MLCLHRHRRGDHPVRRTGVHQSSGSYVLHRVSRRSAHGLRLLLRPSRSHALTRGLAVNRLQAQRIGAAAFAVVGVGAAVWVVAGPRIAKWWNTPAPEPVVHRPVETDLPAPAYNVLTSDDELDGALATVERSLRDFMPPPAGTYTLSAADRAAVAKEAAAALRPLLTGSLDDYKAWLAAAGGENPELAGEGAAAFATRWKNNSAGFVNAVLGEQVAQRVRYVNGEGPFEAPEDELFAGTTFVIANGRFKGLPAGYPPDEAKKARLTIVEAIVPVMHVSRDSGTPSNTMLGFWFARKAPTDPWRLWRISLYDMERPSKALTPWF